MHNEALQCAVVVVVSVRVVLRRGCCEEARTARQYIAITKRTVEVGLLAKPRDAAFET
jgi:hypothetical protein